MKVVASPDISGIADGLWAIAQAPRADWQAHAHRIEGKTAVVVGWSQMPCAMLLASAGKAIARQMPHCLPECEDALRGIAMELSNVLAMELAAAGRAAPPAYHIRGEG